MSHLPAVFLALIWMWSDCIGTLLSVISTYFYFGWEGTPQLVPKIFGLALLAFSGPLFYRVLLYRIPPAPLSRALLLLLFGVYTALSVQRESDFFAWGALGACWLSGVLLMTLFRQLRESSGLFWSYTLQVAFFFYLSTRIAQGGLPLILLAPQGVGWMPWLMLTVIVLVGLFLPHRPVSSTESFSLVSPSRWRGSLGMSFGLLMGLSVGVIENLHIWSARTPTYPAAIYFLSLGLGALAGGFLFRSGWSDRLKMPLAALAMGLGIYGLLYLDVSAWPGVGQVMGFSLMAHGLSTAGLMYLWTVFFRQYQRYQAETPHFFPWVSLQVGFVFLLLILAIFLLKANPIGFWIALVLSVLILSLHRLRFGDDEAVALPAPIQRLWHYACALFCLVGGVSLWAPTTVALKPALAEVDTFQVMSTNIRYGWTDDYRFDPLLHVRYLRERLPQLMGVQEMNKGHTSGAYSDLFRLYQQALPGRWFYGDANYGFGNALFSQFKVLNSENRVYTAKDMLKRSCLVNTVEINGQPVTVLVTHVSHLAPPNPVRQSQIRELSDWIQELNTPWILIGDFNATPDSAEIQSLVQLAHPLYREHPEWVRDLSYPAVHPDRRIDYIFFSSDFELKKMEVLENGTSTDHRPVLAELRLPAPQTP